MRRSSLLMNIVLLFFILLPSVTAFAICPLCTIAVGVGIGLAQYLGIDDTITGLWIGGLIASLIVWTISWCNKKNIHFYGRKIGIIIVYYGIFISPLCYYGIMGHLLNKLWGIDKILLGIIVGSVTFFSGNIGHILLRRRNNDKAYFPFQKVAMPVLPLVILSVFFYYLTAGN